MLARIAKPLFGLIVVLAWSCMGSGNRAEASFALGKLALPSVRSHGSMGVELGVELNGEEAEPKTTCSSPGMGKETPPFAPTDSPRTPPLPRDLLLIPVGTLTQGESTPGAFSAGLGSGTSPPLIPPSGVLAAGADESGLLFLAEERLSRPLLASRLFRPPRVV